VVATGSFGYPISRAEANRASGSHPNFKDSQEKEAAVDPNSRVVQVKLAHSEATIAIEATVAGDQRVAIPSQFSFDAIGETLESLAKELGHTIESVKPSKAAIKFGLEVAVESGKLTALLVKGSGKANLEITLEWSK